MATQPENTLLTSVPEVLAPNAQREGAANQAELTREPVGLGTSIAASVSESGLGAIARWFKTPDYEPEDNFNLHGRIKGLDFALTQDELAHLLENKAVSNAQFNDQITRLTQHRQNMQDKGDNPLTSIITDIADPVWLGASLLGGPVGVAARTAGLVQSVRGMRAVGAAVAGAAGLGVGAIQAADSPSYGLSEMVLDSILNAVGGAFLTRRGKRMLDPDYPVKELEDIRDSLPPITTRQETPSWVQKLDDEGNPVMSSSGKPVYTSVTNSEVPDLTPSRSAEVQAVVQEAGLPAPFDAPTAGPARAFKAPSGKTYEGVAPDTFMARLKASADPVVAQLARNLEAKAGPLLSSVRVHTMPREEVMAISKGHPAFYSFDHRVLLSDDVSDGVILHELTHAATAAKINFGAANPGTAHGKLVQELNDLRKFVKQHVDTLDTKKYGVADQKYYSNDIHEFAAGLYSGDTAFFRTLADLHYPKARSNALTALFKNVRRILGFSVSEESALASALKLSDDLLDMPVFQKMVDDSASNWERVGSKYTEGLGAPPAAVQTAVKRNDEIAKNLGMKLSWNLHKTIAKWNPKVANLMVDNPLDPAGDSIESQRRAIRADMSSMQYSYEDALLAAMAKEGAGFWTRAFKQPTAMRVQDQVEKAVFIEMANRSDNARLGKQHVSQFPKHIQDVADRLGDVAEVSLEEQKRSGVQGADVVTPDRNYLSRRWNPASISNAIENLIKQSKGQLDATKATDTLIAMVTRSVRSANGFDAVLGRDIASALVNRAIRKGDMSDSAFRGHVGNEGVAEVRDILESMGVPQARLNRALEVITGVTDEAGKAPSLKHRVELDLREGIKLPDGSKLMVYDLLDSDISRITERYLDGVAARSAYARKGLHTPSDIGKVRQELIESIPANKQIERETAAKLFDNVVNFQNGRAAGDDVPPMMRMMGDVTQMVALQASGLWQVMEYSNIAQQFGRAAAFKYFWKTMPVLRELSETLKTREGATHLKNMLSRNSSQDIRMRPFINRMEDNFEFSNADVAQAVLKNSKQWVPYMNGMKYIHHHQAEMTANLIVDALSKASSGDARAVRRLAQYGLEGHTMDKISKEIAAKGLDTANWSDDIWELARGPMTKMMDDAVLRARVGDIPAFAQFSALGKFIFTFRSFVLAAHNKVLAGTLARDHFAGLSLLLLYQYPLAMLTVQANEVYKGKGYDDDIGSLAKKAALQLGALGLITEPLGIIFGEKQQFGAPGFIALDRVFKTAGAASNLDGTALLKEAINTIPIVPLLPGIQAIRNNLD